MAIFHLKGGMLSSAKITTEKHMLISNVVSTGEEKIHKTNRLRLRNLLGFDLERECRHETRNCQNARNIIANKTTICYRRNTQSK